MNTTREGRLVTFQGHVSLDCRIIGDWNTELSSWYLPDTTLERIHLVYMTHLDVGFTNTSRNVCDTYFDEYFPAAIKVGGVGLKVD